MRFRYCVIMVYAHLWVLGIVFAGSWLLASPEYTRLLYRAIVVTITILCVNEALRSVVWSRRAYVV